MYFTGTLTSLISYWKVGHFCFIKVVHFSVVIRTRVPEADFRVESFVTAVIPACVAVTAIGEVFSYAFDNANNNDARAGVLGRIYGALIPGGVSVFDIAGPNRAPSTDPQRTFREGTDWAVLVETEADQDYKLLTRRITTFRKRGEWYRRDFEIHQLQLLDPVEVLKMLQCIGFSAQVLDRYGTQVLPRGVTGFLARKVPA